jgi:hypothetical protein
VALLDDSPAPPGTAPAVDRRPAVLYLAATVAGLALVATGAGLLWPGESEIGTVTTVHGEQVPLFADGLYRHDSVFKGAANRGTDLVTLVLAVPLLVAAALSYRRGSLRGALALAGLLTWFLYAYASLSLGTAHNELFLVYVVLFSASLFGLALTVRSIDLEAVSTRRLDALPRRSLAWLMLVAGGLTAFVWIEPLVTSLLAGEPPKLLLHSTTMVTEALDLAIITPLAVASGVLLLRARVAGYLVAFPLLVLLWVLSFAILAQTAFQLNAGWEFETPELVGPIGGFVVLGAVATWLGLTVLRRLGDEPIRRR